MPEERHWPFGQEDGQSERDRERALEREQEKLRRAQAAEARKKLRFDRFIVGGRAHVKKRGVS